MISSIVDQFAEQLSASWLIRRAKCDSPQLGLNDLVDHEERLEAHLDGLRINGEPGWRTCEDALMQWRQPGEVFAAAVLAVEQANQELIDRVLPIALASPENERAFVSALGWVSWEQAEATAARLVASSKPGLQRMGIAGYAASRRDPGEALAKAVASSDKRLKARALRAVGELARGDLLPQAQEAMRSREPGCKSAAAWAVGRLSDEPKAIDVLKKVVESRSSGGDRPLQLVLRKMDVKAAAKWLNKLAQDPKLIRQAVIGSGIVGTPESVSWLIQIMATPALARVAGEAFTMITGADLTALKLEGSRPAGFESGPTEDPADENVAMDEDDNLPWPNAAKLAAWWGRWRADFEPQTRYLCGKPLSWEWLEYVLRNGYQRQRAAAALELAIRSPQQPLFNVRAPAKRQLDLLACSQVSDFKSQMSNSKSP